MRPWTVVPARVNICTVMLQWGHGLAAVDGTERRPNVVPVPSFNGATALRPWTDAVCGEPIPLDNELQWGHGLAAVDGW